MPNRREFLEIRHYYDVLDLIKFLTTKLDIVAVLVVHSLALKAGVLAHLPSSTSLLIKYSRAGYVGHSMTLFDEIMYKDVVVWNSMLTAAIKNHYYMDSMKLFVQMIEGNQFDSATLVIVVSVISRSNKLSQGREIHGLSVKAGMMLDTFYCNALVNMYAKCGDLRSSESLFARLECRDDVSWNSMICGCLYNDENVKSLLHFKEMSYTGVLADNVSLSSAVAACTHLGEWDIGQVFHVLGVKLGFDESAHISISNSLIPFYFGCGEINVARSVFRRLIYKNHGTNGVIADVDCSNDSDEDGLDGALCVEVEACIVPPPELPPSTGNIGVPDDCVTDLLSVYSFLRSFNSSLFLSPFGLEDFVGSLNCYVQNTLLDAIHVSLMCVPRGHFEALLSYGFELASKFLSSMDWSLIDSLTWPVFTAEYLMMMGYTEGLKWKGFYVDALQMEYYSLSVSKKLTILQILCDDVLDSAELRAEIEIREESEVEVDRDGDTIAPHVGPKRVHPRYSKTSACKEQLVTILSLTLTFKLVELIQTTMF